MLCNRTFFIFLILSRLSRSLAEWNWNKVFGGRRSPISDDRWQERDERPDVKSCADASPPPITSPPLPFPPSSPELRRLFSQSRNNIEGVCQTHIPPLLPVIPSSLLLFPIPAFSLHLVSKVQYASRGQEKQPTQVSAERAR